jgi:hypothetical protein
MSNTTKSVNRPLCYGPDASLTAFKYPGSVRMASEWSQMDWAVVSGVNCAPVDAAGSASSVWLAVP